MTKTEKINLLITGGAGFTPLNCGTVKAAN
jgi:hypothetical protein